jgi:hypothetical protein
VIAGLTETGEQKEWMRIDNDPKMLGREETDPADAHDLALDPARLARRSSVRASLQSKTVGDGISAAAGTGARSIARSPVRGGCSRLSMTAARRPGPLLTRAAAA